MTDASRRALVALLLGATALFATRALAPVPTLGPPFGEPPCPTPVEKAGEGVVCNAANAVAGDVIGDPARTRMAPARLALFDVALDVNRADACELEALPGVGPALARRIVEGRPYASLDELVRVPGIGARRLAALRTRLTLDGRDGGSSVTMGADPGNDKSGPGAAFAGAR